MKLDRRTVIDLLAAAVLAAVCLGTSLYSAGAASQVSAPPVTTPPSETRRPVLTITADGVVELGPETTIDFATVTQRAGRCRGFIPVRLQGELVLLPVYALPGDDRVYRCELGGAK